ncbi:hypothetical protein D9Q98_005777 [Chlorella vulgaris]|uniref:PAS domain-containing protein n=1 Tax=Chlorella vulgaris TaxID=3077 RepID=A0A9D4TMV3_CHLVU|nr:hypothetical protein D9Q98_005777 [Chlorella vulgaris]
MMPPLPPPSPAAHGTAPPLPPRSGGTQRQRPRPPFGLLGKGMPSAAAESSQKAALAEVSAAFGQLLQDLHFSFVISCARSDSDCPIVYASNNFFSCTGYSPAEVLGRNCRFLQGPATSHHSVMEIRDAIREERPCSVCLLNYRKDKTPFWNFFRLQPIHAPCGNVQWFVGVQADVTRLVEAGGGAPLAALEANGEEIAASIAARLASHQQELTEADRTRKCAVSSAVPSSLVAALSRVQDNFVLSDPSLPDCPIVYASPAFLQLTGYCCSEVVGRNCRFLQGPATDPAVVQQLRDGLAASPPRPVTVTLLNYRKADASGHQEPFWNSLHIAPLRDADGKVQFYVGVQMPITDDGQEGSDSEEEAEHLDTPPTHESSLLAAPAADPVVLLRQKGVVGSLRVATRALAQHGLRRAAQYQHAPCREA